MATAAPLSPIPEDSELRAVPGDAGRRWWATPSAS